MNGKQQAQKTLSIFWGFLLIWGAYFGYRTVEFLQKETLPAEIQAISWRRPRPQHRYKTTPMSHTPQDSNTPYECPETHFLYKRFANDSGMWYVVWPQSLAFMEHKAGERIAVIFPKDQPDQALLYSLGDFWFAAPYVTLLLAISVGWVIVYCVIRFKPWELMH